MSSRLTRHRALTGLLSAQAVSAAGAGMELVADVDEDVDLRLTRHRALTGLLSAQAVSATDAGLGLHVWTAREE